MLVRNPKSYMDRGNTEPSLIKNDKEGVETIFF